jgi:hypothetical protein
MSIQQREIEPGHILTAGISRMEGKGWIGVAGATITSGDLVIASGSRGSHVEVVRADATVTTKSRGVIWVAEHGATIGQQIRMATVRTLVGVNTNAAVAALDPVYLSTSGGWTLIPTGSLAVGVVLVKSATAGVVLLVPQDPITGGGQIGTLTATGTPLTNSVAETVLTAVAVPAGKLSRGSRVRISYKARVTANNGATTLTVRLRMGPTTLVGTILATTAAVDTNVGNIVCGEFMFTARAASSAATPVEGWGFHCEPAAPGGAFITDSFDVANFITNGVLFIELTGQWSAADANSVQAEDFHVELVA